MPLPIERLAADKFDESKINRDRKGRFSDKPGMKGPDMPSGGSSGGSGKRMKKKTNPRERADVMRYAAEGRNLPDPGDPPQPGDRKQVAEIEKALNVEAEAAADALDVGLPTGTGFEKAKFLITKIGNHIAERAQGLPKAIRKKYAAWTAAAINQIDKVADLDPKDYYDIPEAAIEYLHLFAEHSEVIHTFIEHNPFTEAEDDEVHAGMNWVEKAGGLPRYIKEIADALQRDHGYTESRAIATAVNRCKKWCAGVGNVHPDTRAKACAAVAEWEAKKAGRKVAEAGDDDCGCGSATPPEVANRAADVMFG